MTTVSEVKSPTCSVCRHRSEAPLDASNFAAARPLECRRYPPTAIPIFSGGMLAGMASAYPPVQPLQLCGEFKAPDVAGVFVESSR